MREVVKENGVDVGASGTAGAIELLLATGVCGIGVGSTLCLTLLVCTSSANPASCELRVCRRAGTATLDPESAGIGVSLVVGFLRVVLPPRVPFPFGGIVAFGNVLGFTRSVLLFC